MNSQGNAMTGGFWDRSGPELARQRSAALARTVADGRSRLDTGGTVVAVNDAGQTGDGWTVSVRDGGIGIDPDRTGDSSEIFQRPHTQAEHADIAVGLARCRRTGKRHDGGIRVESESGEASTFKHSLPIVKESR